MPAIALTDHGNMFGAIHHYRACLKNEITPIIGCEVDVLREGAAAAPLDHLVLLAETEQGYRNLLRIVSAGHVRPASPDGPSVTLETIADSPEGLIGLTGCMGGVLAQQVLELGEEAGRRTLDRLRGVLPEGSLYVEIQDHGLPEQPVLNRLLGDLAAGAELPLVATNDVHFLHPEDGEAQLYLSCIASGRSFEDAQSLHHGSFEMYLKSAEQMAARFKGTPQALQSTLEIAERCSSLRLKLGTPMLPSFPLPGEHDAASYLREVAQEGLQARLAELRRAGREVDESAYTARLDTELEIIVGMDLSLIHI